MKTRHYFPQTVILLLIVFFIALVSLSKKTNPEYLSVVQQIPVANLLASESPESTPTPIPTPLKNKPVLLPNSTEPAITARAALIVDAGSGETLFAKNEDLPLWPASTTKVMSALVVLDKYDLSDIVTINNLVVSGRTMGLYSGEKISVNNLLHGMLIHSANDAAYALADFHPEGQAGFVADMNEKAKELDLENTHFADPAGFDNDKQYSTANDLANLSLYALKDKTISQIVSIPNITVPDADYITFHKLQNVNQLLGVVPGVAGIKTGYTENAKENLINLTKRNGTEIITVILGSDDRFGETQLLTEWAYTNYRWDDTN